VNWIPDEAKTRRPSRGEILSREARMFVRLDILWVLVLLFVLVVIVLLLATMLGDVGGVLPSASALAVGVLKLKDCLPGRQS